FIRQQTAYVLFFFSSRRRHTRFSRDWSSDVCSSDLCRVLGLCRSSYRYEPRREEPMELLQELRQIASERPRFGYRRLHALLRRQIGRASCRERGYSAAEGRAGKKRTVRGTGES